MEKIFAFYKQFAKLEDILRVGWLMRGLPVERKESDADHTLQTILLADLIINKFNIQGINLLRVIEMLLIHEIGEIVIGDISLIASDHEEKKKMEEQAVREKLSCLGEKLGSYYFGLWYEFEHGTTLDGRFAKFIDRIDADIKAKVYDQQLGVDVYFNDFFAHDKQIIESTEFCEFLRN
ncbi:MAG: HD domain-containing protein [Bacilli bacterium]|nr:HD domain-containing protein [Bacilli bacterium]